MKRKKMGKKVCLVFLSIFIGLFAVPVFTQSPPTLDGLIDPVYYSHGYSVSYKGFYIGAEATLHVFDKPSIDPNYVWLCWEIATTFNDNSYGANQHSTWPKGHNFEDLIESDMQRLDLENTCGQLVLDVVMDYLNEGYPTPSGYGTGKDSIEFPIPGSGTSNYISTGNWAHIEFDTAMSANLNDFGYCLAGNCSVGGTDLFVNSPPWSDEPNYVPISAYSNWEYHEIWELRVDRQVFRTATCPAGTLLGVATNPVELHASPSKSVSPCTLFPSPGTIGDYIWLDADRDGVQDVTEKGLANVTVALYSDPNGDGNPADGSILATTTTDAYGRYLFANIGAGNYTVDVTDTNGILTGLSLTTGSTDPHGTIALSSEENYIDADFGYAPSSGIGDYVWSDADNDGMQDPGEPGIGGVTISLLADYNDDGNFTDVVATTTTRDDGSYLFTGLAADDYRIDVTDTGGVLSGYTLTDGPQSSIDPTDTIGLENGEIYLNADFGYYKAGLGTIGNQIWFEEDTDGLFESGETGIFNVTVDLIKDTDGDGVWDAGEMVVSSITAEDGTYRFSGLSLNDGDGDADYLVHVTDIYNELRRFRKSTGATPGANNNSQVNPYAVAISSATTSNLTGDFGYYFDRHRGLVGDRVWFDLDNDGVQDEGEQGVSGVTVQLEVQGGSKWTVKGSVITDVNGYYYFPNLDTGGGGYNYRTRVMDTNFAAGGPLYGYTGTNQPDNLDESTKLTDSAPQDLSLDFGYRYNAASTYSIGDYVWQDGDGDGVQDGGESGFENVTLSLYRDLDGDGTIDSGEPIIARDVTGGSGNYLFSGLANGSYIVSISDNFGILSGYSKTYGTDNWPVTISGASNLTIDYGYFREDPTLAFIAPFCAYSDGGQVVVHWETTSENGTVGFNLYRKEEKSGRFLKVNTEMLTGLLTAPQGGIYRYLDPGAFPGVSSTYRLEEIESNGLKHIYGPFTVRPGILRIDDPGFGLEPRRGRYSKQTHALPEAGMARLKARQAELNAAYMETAAQPGEALKLGVRENGVYYIPAALIAEKLGVPLQKAVNMIKNLNLALLSQDLPQAYMPASGDSGLYFYGESIDSIYTNENIYRLQKGKGSVMEYTPGGTPLPAPGNETFNDFLHIEKDKYALTALFDDPGADFWLWDFIKGGETGKAFNFYANGAARQGRAALKVRLKGATDTAALLDHHVKISINGTYIGEGQWNGLEAHECDIDFEQSLLNDGGNTVTVTGVLDNGVPHSIFYVDSFDLTYRRYYRAVDNRLLCRADGNPIITISGFSTPDIMVFDVTQPGQPKPVAGVSIDATNRVSFIPGAPGNVYFAATAAGLYAPISATADKPSSLRKKNNSADYVIIAAAGLKEAAVKLADLRRTGGLQAMVVELEDIYDEFNYGITDPRAIKDFLSYAYGKWGGTPKYAVLAGEGSYDYKNILGFGDCLVPPLMASTPDGLFAADNRFGDIRRNDGVPEIAIGRLPVLTAAELQVLVDKMADYESASGPWTAKAMLIADNPDNGGNFPVDSDYLAGFLALYALDKIYLPNFSTVDQARQRIIDGFNQGALLVNYIGHAGLNRFAQEGLLLTTDIPALQNQDRLPLVTAFTCVAGRFEVPGYDCLAEQLLLKSGGGAVAVLSPTGASLNDPAVKLAAGLFQALFQGQEKVIGLAFVGALQNYAASGSAPFILDIYNLLGDPALEIK